ncbi:MAG: YrbL family protein [Thiomicrorhabdus sp.]|nr:YrbL family protein [Thiomicrorhabdus sp.]
MFIAQGRDRACYRHPYKKNICIKISIKPEKQSLREKSYLEYLSRKKVDLHLISQCRGTVITSLGKGYLFDLAVNYDGRLSQTLTQAIKTNSISKTDVTQLLIDLKKHLITQLICIKDISPNNLSYVKTTEQTGFLYIIDGIGNPSHNPLTIRNKSLTHKAINQTWKRLERKVKKLYQPSSHSQPIRKPKKSQFNKKLPFIALSIVILITSFSLLTVE